MPITLVIPKITMTTGLAGSKNRIYVSGAVQDKGEMYLSALGK